MQWNKNQKLFCVTDSYHLSTNETEDVLLFGHISCMTLSFKYHRDFNIPELFALFSLQSLLTGNGQPGHLGASRCWLLAARVSDASPAAGGSVGDGVHHPQLPLLEDLSVYSRLWEFALLDFMRLFPCLILSRCFKALLTGAAEWYELLYSVFALTKCTYEDTRCCIGVTMFISWQISTETAYKIPLIKIHILVHR